MLETMLDVFASPCRNIPYELTPKLTYSCCTMLKLLRLHSLRFGVPASNPHLFPHSVEHAFVALSISCSAVYGMSTLHIAVCGCPYVVHDGGICWNIVTECVACGIVCFIS